MSDLQRLFLLLFHKLEELFYVSVSLSLSLSHSLSLSFSLVRMAKNFYVRVVWSSENMARLDGSEVEEI